MQTALTGLTPSTQYFFRLDTTSDLSGTTHGEQQSFTTPAAAQTTPPLGSLPAALSLATSSGIISGTPTAAGTSHFTTTVSDAGTPTAQTAVQALSITVDRAATSARLAASANPLRPRRTVSYTATVSRSAPGSGVPTGKVAFSSNGAPIRCSGGSRTLNSAGMATCTISCSAPGTHVITATYQGDAHFTDSQSQTFSETVR